MIPRYEHTSYRPQPSGKFVRSPAPADVSRPSPHVTGNMTKAGWGSSAPPLGLAQNASQAPLDSLTCKPLFRPSEPRTCLLAGREPHSALHHGCPVVSTADGVAQCRHGKSHSKSTG